MADNVTSLFRGTAAAGPSGAPAREGDGTGPMDFSVPCNPYFPTPEMFQEMAARLRDIATTYPSGSDTIAAELCGLLQLPPQCVALGNGSTELITWIDHLMVRESLAVPVPTFGRWTDQPMETGKRVDMFPLPESGGFALDPGVYAEFLRKRGTRVAVVCNPNNPDGGFLPRHSVVQFLDAMADLDLIVVDECFLEFADAEGEASVVQEAMLRPNVVVLRSLGKNLGLHGVRLGYLVANPALAGRIRAMLPKRNVNSLAEQVVFMLRENAALYRQSLAQVRYDRQEMAAHLATLPGLTVYPSQGNFLFVRLPVGAEGTVVRDRMLAEHRILVRECGNKIGSSSRFLRLVVRPQADVRRLVSGLESVLYEPRRGAAVPEPGLGTGYSSGTAAVDRLVSETNGSGLRAQPGRSAGAAPGLPAAPAAGTGVPLPAAAVAAPPAQQDGGMPLPAQAPQQPLPTVPPAAPVRPPSPPQPAAPPPMPPPMPVPVPVPVPAAAQRLPPLPQPVAPAVAVPPLQPAPPLQPVPPMPAAAPVPGPDRLPSPVPVPGVPGAVQPPAAALPGPTPAGVPARGGLTAAQVRGMTAPPSGLTPAPATGWPSPQNWPNAAGMGQAG
ncbi:pyridoxal phosphate-dependent aminotransferase [Streptomyces tropicalis]|uniref:histidinol-phosphate transaminase n=1 Tax=Streptomyces tropicalis TaxID=3034234 RepID=A0ABT5ZYT2_9ACTN|nr:histidinol-phosphate transaminase [Streptomyces tropicalis]MDF3297367.1 histidinol-phosphate transaminase [Streptomyces tropicalis]